VICEGVLRMLTSANDNQVMFARQECLEYLDEHRAMVECYLPEFGRPGGYNWWNRCEREVANMFWFIKFEFLCIREAYEGRRSSIKVIT
jgi:hypothetical protein